MIRRKIFLHGALKKYAREPLVIHAATVAEAVNGACKLLKIKSNAITGRHRVKVLGFDTVESLFEKSDREDLHIVPAFCGAKGGLLQVVVGSVLIVAGTILQGVPGMQLVGTIMVHFGAAMVLGGLMQMLFPTPTENGRRFSYLGAPENTTAIGTPIPLLLGECRAYGQILSYNVQAVSNR